MKYLKFLAAIIFLSSCSTQTFYIVRHAEKVDGSDAPVLSPAGIQRGIDLEK